MTHRNNQIDFVEFPVSDTAAFEHTRDFYADVFGWSYRNWGEDYADTHDSGVGSGLNADPENRSGAALPVIYSNDLKTSQAAIAAAGGTITRAIFSFPGGRRFHFCDPAGNELAVWSDK